ncbi:L-rhamnose/proton symporter RhaT [Anseongella ginsenosidimutans]|uniref:L-rhamnose/proton symporter RhaT n=1 Tax=Anseongella ginsenosidimutans TaxID=496056 RepID=UPI0032C409A5
MGAVLGVIFHAIGGFASGSFYIPFKKVRNWAWESFWIVGGIFSWLVVPFIAAWLTIPGFMSVICGTEGETVFWTYAMGFLWGIGGLTFGLGIRYLGVSLGQSVALGFTSAFGALLPPIYRDLFSPGSEGTFSSMLTSTGGRLVLLGALVCLAGIYICGKAGMLKEAELSDEQKQKA